MPLPDETAFASVTELGRRLRAGEFTSVELTEFFLNRLETIGPKLNAVVTVTRDRALPEARQADDDLQAGRDRGPLHGIPYGAKDLLATTGIPTTWGAPPFKDQKFDVDATVIVKLHNAGAVLAAKLAMIEIAGGLGYRQANSTFTGPGLNPWNLQRWAGGSSSGSGAAVAAGLVPFAIGTETWGSIMTPASYCGVTGFRPTYGRISKFGAMALSWTLDKLGPLGRTADDCGKILAAIAGADPADASAVERTFAWPEKGKGTDENQGSESRTPPGSSFGREGSGRFRLGVLTDGIKAVQPEVKASFEASLKVLEQFAKIENVTLPDLPYGSVASIIISCEMAAAFEGLATSGKVWEMTADEDRWGLYSALAIPAKDYINAMRIRGIIQQELDAALAPFDAVLCPTTPTVAYPNDRPWDEYRKGMTGSQIGGASNAAGVPAISIPNGFGEEGLPTGLMFVGRAFEEARLLAIAVEFQKRTEWHAKIAE